MNATQGSVAQFVCTVPRGSVFWLFNEENLQNLNSEHRVRPFSTQLSGGGETSVLHVPASEINNNSVIQCGVTIHNEMRAAFSKKVHLKVQGG